MEPVAGVSWSELLGLDRALPWLLGGLALGYIAGAIPVGLLVARAFGAADPRHVGSGGIGATNMLRAGGWRLGALTLALDAAKGYAPTAVALSYAGPDVAAFAGVGAFVGHCASVFLRFKGGKGVATGFGALIAWRWEAALAAAALWALIAVTLRIASVASIAAGFAGLVLLMYFEEWTYVWPFLGMLAVMVARHRDNLRRLMRGEEHRIGRIKAPPGP